jgi:TrmH family RNA methyltransferase
MLTPQELDRIAIVLVRARNPNNIGAAARAMYDFGFSTLRLANDFPVPFEAARSAIDASAVLASAAEFPSVAAAVADCTLVVGTTAVGERNLDHPLHPLAEASSLLRAELDRHHDARVAVLFGSEKTGLSNDELSHCHWLLTIPMHPRPDLRHPSMNLGQAVAVCLYEFVRDSQNPLPGAGRTHLPATSADLERLTHLLHEVLEASEYTRHHPANSTPADLRRLLLRLSNTGVPNRAGDSATGTAGTSPTPVDRTDAPVLMGILRQLLWKLRNPSRP